MARNARLMGIDIQAAMRLRDDHLPVRYALALQTIRALWASRRALQADLIAARARTPVGYITAYRNAEGEVLVEFDGTPFATQEAARADLVDAVEHCMPGLTCRTLTLYDEEI